MKPSTLQARHSVEEQSVFGILHNPSYTLLQIKPGHGTAL